MTASADVSSPPAFAPTAAPLPVKDVRRVLPSHAYRRSTAKGVCLFLVAAASYGGCFAAMLLVPWWWAEVGFALGCAMFTAVLFVIGHDACHGSLTPVGRLNRLIGRLSFLPSLHPYASWEHTHNGLHHAWTNVRSLDPGYPPFTKREFDRLPRWRRLAERLYRSSPGLGLGLFYLVEVWWRHEMWPARAHQVKGDRRRRILWDRRLVVGYAILEAAAVVGAHAGHPNGWGLAGVATDLCVCLLLPFLVWNWVMGFVTYLHHTHPRVAWYESPEQWSFYDGQIRSVVHVEMPWVVEAFLHNILQHTAHHVDPRIPLYNLCDSQRALERRFGQDVVVERWSLPSFLRTMSACKLYDYEKKRWLDFEGRVSDGNGAVQEDNGR